MVKKEMKITGPHGTNQICGQPSLPAIPVLHPVILISLDLLRSTWLASDMQQILISSVP
jgi:hypothetical protein